MIQRIVDWVVLSSVSSLFGLAVVLLKQLRRRGAV